MWGRETTDAQRDCERLAAQRRLKMENTVIAASPLDIPVRGIPGVVEWVLANNGTVQQFNPHVLLCEVRGLKCRYFVTEGWIGVKTETCPSGKAIECLTLGEFVSTVIENAPNAKYGS